MTKKELLETIKHEECRYRIIASLSNEADKKDRKLETRKEKEELKRIREQEKLHQKLEDNGSVESSSEYMKISNKVFGERRHKSRIKVM